jgi:hypothetical protein
MGIEAYEPSGPGSINLGRRVDGSTLKAAGICQEPDCGMPGSILTRYTCVPSRLPPSLTTIVAAAATGSDRRPSRTEPRWCASFRHGMTIRTPPSSPVLIPSPTLRPCCNCSRHAIPSVAVSSRGTWCSVATTVILIH